MIIMVTPAFPGLVPKVIDPQWFSVDKACDDEFELNQLEKEHQNWVKYLLHKPKLL